MRPSGTYYLSAHSSPTRDRALPSRRGFILGLITAGALLQRQLIAPIDGPGVQPLIVMIAALLIMTCAMSVALSTFLTGWRGPIAVPTYRDWLATRARETPWRSLVAVGVAAIVGMNTTLTLVSDLLQIQGAKLSHEDLTRIVLVIVGVGVLVAAIKVWGPRRRV